MHPRRLLLGPTLSSLSLAAGVSSSQCFNGNFQSSTRRPGSSDSHPQRFSFSPGVKLLPHCSLPRFEGAQILDTLAGIKLVSPFHPFI